MSSDTKYRTSTEGASGGVARRELEADGWLEHTHNVGQVKFFRLGETATGSPVVVPLHSRPTA